MDIAPTTEEILREAKLLNSHWGKRILAAEANEQFSDEDISDAEDWQTCACGRQSAQIPRSNEFNEEGKLGAPKDGLLRGLGHDFYSLVSTDDFEEAARTLVRIEERSAEILGEVALNAQ